MPPFNSYSIHGRRRPFAEELPDNSKTLTFSEKEVIGCKEYFLKREKFFELGIFCAILVGFFIGLLVN